MKHCQENTVRGHHCLLGVSYLIYVFKKYESGNRFWSIKIKKSNRDHQNK